MIIKEEDPCGVDVRLGLGLTLGLGCAGGGIPSGGGAGVSRKRPLQQTSPPVQFHTLFPSRPKRERKDDGDDDDDDDHERCVPSRDRHGGCLSGLTLSTPGAAAADADEDEDSVDKGTRADDSGGGLGAGVRKKLRLSKDQSALLEDSFRQHSTLNPAQKQELAHRLSLRPRQVEVWFQNRRARTKLKQTEVDCEFLKKCCETLTDENRRLKRELQELRSMRTGTHPFFLQLHKPAAAGAPAASLCPSCERVATKPDGTSGARSGVLSGIKASSPRFYSCAAATVKDTSSVACCK